MLIMALVAFVFILIIGFGIYPLAIADGKIITSRQYYKSYNLAYNYFSYFNNFYGVKDSPEFEKEMKLTVMQGLIDEIIVDKKLAQEFKKSELQQKVNEKVNQMYEGENFKKILSEITKVSEDDIKNYFIENQAKNDILAGRLDLEGKNVVSWLVEKRKEIKIYLLAPHMKWEKGEIEWKD